MQIVGHTRILMLSDKWENEGKKTEEKLKADDTDRMRGDERILGWSSLTLQSQYGNARSRRAVICLPHQCLSEWPHCVVKGHHTESAHQNPQQFGQESLRQRSCWSHLRTFSRCFCPKRFTEIHTLMSVAAMQGAAQHIRSSLGFSILPKDTSPCEPGELNQRQQDAGSPPEPQPPLSGVIGPSVERESRRGGAARCTLFR